MSFVIVLGRLVVHVALCMYKTGFHLSTSLSTCFQWFSVQFKIIMRASAYGIVLYQEEVYAFLVLMILTGGLSCHLKLPGRGVLI